MVARRRHAPVSLVAGYEVMDVPRDGDCFFSAVIASAHLSIDVPHLRKKAHEIALNAGLDEELQLAVQFGKVELTKLRNNGHYVGLRKLETEDPSLLKDITNSEVKPLKVKQDSLEALVADAKAFAAEVGVEQPLVKEDPMETLVTDTKETNWELKSSLVQDWASAGTKEALLPYRLADGLVSFGVDAALLIAQKASMEKRMTALEAEVKEQKVIAANCRRRAERVEEESVVLRQKLEAFEARARKDAYHHQRLAEEVARYRSQRV
ncbi:hypothetical protein KFL_007020090 [Klebsormidium nitens]|uniref:OTU domain-containing protein n=1 Tax=Klebsormidium nitens TaxID=105231 RepID=A0A1Y1ILB0_KLENI|nr:hypothetical protein KFL_007020090 [Klebsormidium nitens]|eukprot:GAQ90922.1 hypothetical protein KFL_007020090 [Klebsormidium nitens]